MEKYNWLGSFFTYRVTDTLCVYQEESVCACLQPADRPLARNPRDVSRCPLERGDHAAKSRDFRRSIVATLFDSRTRAANRYYFSCRHWSLGGALQFCSAFCYPSERQRAPGAPPPFRSCDQ